MAKLKKSISLKNVYIDSADPLNIQEIGKDYTLFYNLKNIALEFAGKEGVSITFAYGEDIASDPDAEDEDAL